MQTPTKTRRLSSCRPDTPCACCGHLNRTTYLRGAKRPVRRNVSGLTCLRPHKAASRWATQTQTKTGAPGSRPSNDTKASHMALSPSAGLLHVATKDLSARAYRLPTLEAMAICKPNRKPPASFWGVARSEEPMAHPLVITHDGFHAGGPLHGGMTDVCASAPLRLYVRDDCRSPMQTQTEARCWCYGRDHQPYLPASHS